MSIFHRIFGLLNMDIGIDLGTANTLVYVKDEGIKVRQPSVVAVKTGTNEVVAVGDDAKRMLGRTPDTIHAVRPLRDGVIADFEMTEAMLKHFIFCSLAHLILRSPHISHSILAMFFFTDLSWLFYVGVSMGL